MVSKGRVITISDLKEVLKARLKKRTDRKEAKGDLITRATSLGNVLSNSSQSTQREKNLHRKREKKTLPET